jgi:hypothetical protein
MASTYTDNTGIEKPGSGEQSGTWGATTNTNFDLIDRSLNGVGDITLAGTTHTLSTSDGSLSDGHYRVLVLGGTPTGACTITISPNDQEKLYFVYNNSGQDAIFSQGSGANITVANGDQAIIYADGAGSTAAVAEIKPPAGAVGTGQVDTAQLVADAVTTSIIADDAVTQAKIEQDVQIKSGTASVTLSATAFTTFVKHSGTGTLSIGAGQYDGQTINIVSIGTMTLSWGVGALGVSLGNDVKIASGIWDDTNSYWFFSETIT